MDAFEDLFRTHQARVYRWILAVVRDPAAAEDLTIETFWRVYRAGDRFDRDRAFEPWVRRIATNLAISHLRHARHEVAAESHVLDAHAGPPAADSAVSRDERAAIARAFAALPAKLKAVARLALIEETPYAEIAGALGITLQAVKSREFRAVRRLRESLAKVGIHP